MLSCKMAHTVNYMTVDFSPYPFNFIQLIPTNLCTLFEFFSKLEIEGEEGWTA